MRQKLSKEWVVDRGEERRVISAKARTYVYPP